MLFNSLDFAFFLPIVFILYWLIGSERIKFQNIFLVIASYFFYGCWNPIFLLLIFVSTVTDYLIGLQIHATEARIQRRLYLMLSLFVNLGLLCFFKYYNFFTDSFVQAFTFLGFQFKASRLNIILPVGISFYTFQTLSYTIDIYKKKLNPTKDFISFMGFVSFFPQLVAGPIEKASELLPQFFHKRKFEYAIAVDGLKQILWGLFKKVVIADNCAQIVDLIFSNYTDYSGSTLLLGAILFAFQIYGDFSGYSDIAIGTAKLFGFKLMKNFSFPYFSRDIAEFWRRWHISLSSWFKEYLYIPLGGSRGSTNKTVRNMFIIFLVSGFWHGANWTYIVWGGLNAIYFLPLLLRNKNRNNLAIVAQDNILPSITEVYNMGVTFFLTVLAWVFFRASSISEAVIYIKGIFSKSLFTLPHFENMRDAFTCMLLISFLLVIEWIARRKDHVLEIVSYQHPKLIRWSIYMGVIFLIGMFANTNETPFIYFQF